MVSATIFTADAAMTKRMRTDFRASQRSHEVPAEHFAAAKHEDSIAAAPAKQVGLK